MLQIRKLRQVDCFFLFVMIAYAFDFGNLKYAMAWCFSAIYFLGSGLYEKRRLRGIGKEYLLVFDGITFLFAITAILQMINGFNSYAINETSLDKGTQRKTTENELPSLTQCTA